VASGTASGLSLERGPRGYRLVLRAGDGAEATVEPLALETAAGTVEGAWGTVEHQASSVRAYGRIGARGSVVRFTLDANAPPGGEEPATLRWHVEFEGAPFTGALLHRVLLHGVTANRNALDLPSIHYSANTYGKGLFPQPDPARGFAFRADRMAQPAIHYASGGAVWSYFAGSEAPVPPMPDLLYSLGIEPPSGGGLSLVFCYPQHEYGHLGDGGPDAYIAKSTFGPGEKLTFTWQPGDVLEKTLYLWRHSSAGPAYDAPARFLWRNAYPRYAAKPGETSLWWQAAQHIRWFNARLYNSEIGGGQYESPEGSGTAMLGFVEHSLSMASATFAYANLALASPDPPLPAEELRALCERAAGALTRWATEGRSQEGLLYTICDRDGYSFGWRDYADYDQLGIVKDDTLDTVRVASEARMLIGAARSARFLGCPTDADPSVWEEAALGVCRWLAEHALPGGGYSARYARTGEPLDPYPAGTGAVISLLTDCAFLLEQRGQVGDHFVGQAVEAYESTLGALIRRGELAGGTLDASTPDREAAVAALDACIRLYERTGEPQYLSDAGAAAANLLSYTLVYPITTFAPDTDAGRAGISTFGATIVSPENQHLDPVATTPGLVIYGLFAGDDVCTQAGIESLRWTLDGRWAIKEEAGLKQSEQLLNTRWYYNTFFMQRGDYRRGMPLWGREDSEHGWPQVVPTGALLGSGQVMLDWPTARAAALDQWRVDGVDRRPDGALTLRLSGQGEAVYLRVLRVPTGSKFRVEAGGEPLTLSGGVLEHGCMLNVGEGKTLTLRLV
jgi:hypothetical protein